MRMKSGYRGHVVASHGRKVSEYDLHRDEAHEIREPHHGRGDESSRSRRVQFIEGCHDRIDPNNFGGNHLTYRSSSIVVE